MSRQRQVCDDPEVVAGPDAALGPVERRKQSAVCAPLYYRVLVLDEPVTERAADLAAAATTAAGRAGVFVSPA